MSQLTFGQRMNDMPILYHRLCKEPAEIFQTKLDRLSDALVPYISPIIDKLYANKLITSTIARTIKGSHCTDYDKASRIVYELLRQLKYHEYPDEYLRRICDLFDSLNDLILRDITLAIMSESGCVPNSRYSNYIK